MSNIANYIYINYERMNKNKYTIIFSFFIFLFFYHPTFYHSYKDWVAYTLRSGHKSQSLLYKFLMITLEKIRRAYNGLDSPFIYLLKFFCIVKIYLIFPAYPKIIFRLRPSRQESLKIHNLILLTFNLSIYLITQIYIFNKKLLT